MDRKVAIREFEPGDEACFRTLNEEWISHYFKMEDKDREALDHPRSAILAKGGRIFFALVDGECVGCCALLRLGEAEFEVAKMAISPSLRGGGIGRVLLAAVVEAARASGVRRLYLETNSILGPAIRLYESIGFRHLPPERVQPSPYARANVYMELVFD